VPLRRTSQRYDQRTHINRSRGCSIWAECQVSPPSTLTSTWSMAPAPLQAYPRIMWTPGDIVSVSSLGWVMMDFTPMVVISSLLGSSGEVP
jgi:hypothetical protein